ERQVDDATEERQQRERDERDVHGPGRLVRKSPRVRLGQNVVSLVRVAGPLDQGRVVAPALGTVEDEPYLTSHVERRNQCARDADRPERVVVAEPGLGEDLVLRPEAREGEDARDRERTEDERSGGDRHV